MAEPGDLESNLKPAEEQAANFNPTAEQKTFQTYKRNDSLKIGKNSRLVSIADSISLIHRRDSERALLDLENQSPWLLNPGTPMVSSPHLTPFPDLRKRRNEQLREHELKKIEAKRSEARRRQRSTSVDDGDGRFIAPAFISPVRDEQEQWERKRKQKLQQTMQTSASDSAFSTESKVSFSGSATSGYSPTNDMLKELREEFAKQSNPPGVSIMYGLVNAIIVLPVIMSFGNIIFHDEYFKPYLPILVKLTVVSGVVHQLCFSTLSTLPFAVGSVQDAGLIFLSTIASNIVVYCRNQGCSDEEILATTLVGLSIFTAILGAGLILIGRLKLAGYVQQLPTSVVGGYLAFIGFFCGQSALCLLSGTHVSGILEWYKFLNSNALLLIAPGVVGGVGIYVTVRKLNHMAVLPASIAILVTAFYVILKLNGLSLEDAKEIGFMSRAESPPVWYHTWDFIKFDKVIWGALPGQIFTVCSMIFVVALSSSLDIAAIDLEVSKPLAYNYELAMIGISNLVSGLTGGYTGSYIFSQSIFSLRAGIRSRLAGYVTAIIGLITVVMPISILSFVPNFIFASLLIMICVDLMIEWLWDVRKKLSHAEYSVALSTFALIQMLGVAYGILAGIGYHIILSKICSHYGKSVENDDLESEKAPILQEGTTYNSTCHTDNSEVGLSI